MEASNITITKETMKKMNTKLSNKKKGALRLQKLRELSQSGKLAMIRSRGDLAEAVGYPYSQRSTSGYQWVKFKVDNGWLKETISGYTDDGHAEFEYEFIDKDKMNKPNKEAETKILAEYDRLKKESVEKSMAKLTSPMITIHKGDTTITLEFVSEQTVVEIIKSIVKGE